ncbi:MAG: four helix bundle protein [Flavobacteriaceae bacterium]|nr:four helix bundle protein [Flavobacteriaceae bacterium]
MRNFRKYDIWIDAVEITDKVYCALDTFPKKELYALASQMSRAAVSVPSNIAEGASRYSEKDFARFLEYSLGSSFELETQLIIALRRNYIKESQQTIILEELMSLQKRISGLIKKILKK